MPPVIVTGGFDQIHAPAMRFLQQAARLGPVTLLLDSDEKIIAQTGRPPRFPEAERRYFWSAVRYVEQVIPGDAPPGGLPPLAGVSPAIWAMPAQDASPARLAWCAANRVEARPIEPGELEGCDPPPPPDRAGTPGRKKVLVTGCYDWLHSGHVRFFEEAAQYGDLYVIVGNDANVRNLKGAGHPLFPQDLRRYMVGAIRFVHQALITSGWGWMDAEPEIATLRPEIYLVNEDGDRPEKRAFCAQHGLEYVVLKRLPKEGLQRRSSTDLRGF